MKRILPLLLLLVIAVTASAAGRDNLLSRLRHKNIKTTVEASGQKTDAMFEAVRKPFAEGKISADSVVSLALYHKAWSPQLAEQCLKLVADDANPRSIRELGMLYTFSPSFAGQTEDGLKLLQEAAQHGNLSSYKRIEGISE